jgi:hypothetical protein
VLQSWAICREEAAGELTYLGIVSAESEAYALLKARLLLTEESRNKLIARLWEGPQPSRSSEVSPR